MNDQSGKRRKIMKQIILKKTEVDYHRAWYDTDGPHFAHDKNDLMEEADRQIRLKGIEDIWYVYSMKETEDKKGWIVAYFTLEDADLIRGTEDEQ